MGGFHTEGLPAPREVLEQGFPDSGILTLRPEIAARKERGRRLRLAVRYEAVRC